MKITNKKLAIILSAAVVSIITLIVTVATLPNSEEKKVSYNRKLPPIYFNTASPSPKAEKTVMVKSIRQEEPTMSPISTEEPTVEPTENPTVEPTQAPTQVPVTATPKVTETPKVTAKPTQKASSVSDNHASKTFSTNKVYITTYSYTDKKHTQGNGNYYFGGAAYNGRPLVPIYDVSDVEVVDGKEIVVHSCAAWVGEDKLPPNSIIYLNELNLYFRVDDNNGNSSSSIYPTKKAWNLGCSIWLDLYVGRAAFEGYGGIMDYGKGVDRNLGKPVLPISSGTIEWSDGLFSFSQSELQRIQDFVNVYYSLNSNHVCTFKVIRVGK